MKDEDEELDETSENLENTTNPEAGTTIDNTEEE